MTPIEMVEVEQTRGLLSYSVRVLAANGIAVTVNAGLSRDDAEELSARLRMAIGSHLGGGS